MVRGGTPVIRSLTFKSNKRTLGPFGMEIGTPFSSPLDDGRIVGFKGRSGHHLDAIGFHVSLAKLTYLPGHTISFPNRRWRDDHIQGTKLPAPGYNRDPCGPSFLRQFRDRDPCVPSLTRHFGDLTAPVFWNLKWRRRMERVEALEVCRCIDAINKLLYRLSFFSSGCSKEFEVL